MSGNPRATLFGSRLSTSHTSLSCCTERPSARARGGLRSSCRATLVDIVVVLRHISSLQVTRSTMYGLFTDFGRISNRMPDSVISCRLAYISNQCRRIEYACSELSLDE